ncbi:MAG TPA: TIM-barrel domain-containing protein [Planktothrix sp.]
METFVNWEGARETRARKGGAQKGQSIFAGGLTTETATIAGVKVVRLSVWPKGAKAAPMSHALTLTRGMPGSQEEVYPDDADADFGSDEVEVERRNAPSAEFAEDFKGFVEEPAAVDWQVDERATLPLNFSWQQSSESRWDFFFDLARDAVCMGLGERQSGLNLRSRRHTLFTTDDYDHIETIDQMYQAIPFLIVRHQQQYYGIFLDSPGRQRWDLDTDLSGIANIELLSRRGWQLYCLGPTTLPELVAAYTTLTGRAGLPPVWSIGHQQSRWSYPDQETAIRIALEFRQRKIPCDVIVLDIDYMDDYRVFTYSKERFPEFKEMIRDLGNNNFKVITIIDPGVKQDEKFFVFNDGEKHKYFCTTGDGKSFIDKVWPGLSAFPDFMREDVRLWWAAQHGFHTENGVAGIWNDMNEPSLFEHQRPLEDHAYELPPDEDQLFMQHTPEGLVGHFEVRNLYGMQMSRATHDGLLALRPGERPFVLTRSGYAGIQKYAAVWLGDNKSWWTHLAHSIPMLVNMGLSGVAFVGVDIGGFFADCTPELLVRWYEVGIFYPLFRNHCSMFSPSQEPWVFGEEIEDHCRNLIELRYRLLPHIQMLFNEHRRTGAPLIKPLCWHYPDDMIAAEIDDQFLFGEDILVAPILQRGKTMRSVYFPEGTWHSLDGAKTYDGARTHVISMPLGQVPAFVREGTILALADPMQSTAELLDANITFKVYGKNARGTYYVDDGESLDYQEGAYDLWKLRIDDGRFLAQPIELGYERSRREFKLDYQDGVKPITLTP